MNTAYTYRRNFCKNISNEYYGHFKTQGTISFQIFFRKRGTPNNTQKNISHKTLWMKLRFVGLKRCDINKYKNIRTYASGSIKKKKNVKEFEIGDFQVYRLVWKIQTTVRDFSKSFVWRIEWGFSWSGGEVYWKILRVC